MQGSIDYRGWKHSDSAKKFIQQTAMVNAGLRLTALQALNHPWLASVPPPSNEQHSKWNDTIPSSPKRIPSKIPNELVISFDLFRMAPPLKRVALNALARKQTVASKYKALFRELDTTKSGTLTKAEFMEAFKNTGNSSDELEDLFQKLDVNCNGEILYTEFLAATLEAEGELEEGQLQEAFDLIDNKKTGYITSKDLARIF